MTTTLQENHAHLCSVVVFNKPLLASRSEKRYNKSRMTAETLRMLLAGCLVAMYVLAMTCLLHRHLGIGQFIAWGIFALFIPALGPFLAILNRPGGSCFSRRSRSIARR